MKEPDAVDDILRFFSYTHLPPKLQEVSAPLCKIAHQYAAQYIHNTELRKGLDRLLEAKDCFVRSVLFN